MPSALNITENIVINSETDDTPFGNPASILQLAGGGFIVFWSESSANDGSSGCVQARFYNADGVPTGPQFIVNASTLNSQAIPDAVQLPNGNIMVTWLDGSLQGGDASLNSVKGRIISPAGTFIGGEFLINTVTSGSQGFATNTLLNSGNVMVVWVDFGGSDGDVAGIKAQIVDATGVKVGGEFLVNTNTTGAQNFPNVTKLADGNVVVTWNDNSGTLGDASGSSVKAQILDASGNKVGVEFLVNTQTANAQSSAQIAALANGNFVATWQDASAVGGDTDSSGIKAQIFDSTGIKIGSEFLVNTTTLGAQTNPAITAMSNGSFIIGWRDSNVLAQAPRGQVFNADGTRIGDEFIARHTDGTGEIAGSPMIADLGGNRFVVTSTVAILTNGGPPQISLGLQGNIFTVLNQFIGSSAAEPLTGSAQADFIDGKGGSDNLSGLDGIDLIYGGDGNDVIDGGQGNDQLYGDAGDDILNDVSGMNELFGGIGNDRIVIGAGAAGSVIDGGANSDILEIGGSVSSLASLIGIEALEFVGGANLTIAGAQFASGLAKTTAVSGNGSLTVNMDAGVSFLSQSFAFSGGGVTVTVNGTAGSDIVKSGGAEHVVNAGAGNDQIRGGLLADTINGGDNNDKIMGFSGADILTGGAGNDQFRYLFDTDSGLGAAADRITDFVIGSDRLNFALMDADAVTPGDQAFAFIGTGAFAVTGTGQIRYQNSGANLLVQVDTDGNGTADMEVVLDSLAGQILTGGDFLL